MFLLKIISSIILTTIAIIKSPIYWVVVSIVLIQYTRIRKLEKSILGTNKEPVYLTIIKSSMWGIVGGLLGNVIIIFLGITIEGNDFKYIFILAIILMLIHPRFICFSYAGGIISILNIITGYPDVNVSSILAIVAILHLIESFLILIDGDSSKIPVFVERDNKIVGGFNMYKFWSIPFIVFILTTQTTGTNGLRPTDWWPIFRTIDISYGIENISYLFVGVIAGLGYGDIAITDYPEKKIKKSAINLFAFSCILLALAIISTHIIGFKIIAALFSPIAHELIIKSGKRKEQQGKPIFTPVKNGLRVLDIMPKTLAQKIGLESGDIILSINGFQVNTKKDINEALYLKPKGITIKYIKRTGKIISKDIKDYKKGISSLGVLLLPYNCDYSFIVEEIQSPILIIIKKVKRVLSKSLLT